VLTAISGSSRRLSAATPGAAQVSFSPNGKVLVVSEIDTNVIDTYTVGGDGRATGPLVQNSAGGGPFGFAFDTAGQLIVSEVTNSSASSYTVSAAGVLSVVTPALDDFGKAACWALNTNNANFAQQYSYVTNTGSNSITGFAIATDGGISLLNSDGVTFQLPDSSYPLDMAISSDSNYLYVVEGKSYGGLAGFQIHADGSLTQLQDILGLPMSEYGIVGY
jgi:6-phosphogluconolactonase (cycloisomerase 2 family)